MHLPTEWHQLPVFLEESKLRFLVSLDDLFIRVDSVELPASLPFFYIIRQELTQNTLVELLNRFHTGNSMVPCRYHTPVWTDSMVGFIGFGVDDTNNEVRLAVVLKLILNQCRSQELSLRGQFNFLVLPVDIRSYVFLKLHFILSMIFIKGLFVFSLCATFS